MMEATSKSSCSFPQTLLTQAQSSEEGSVGSNYGDEDEIDNDEVTENWRKYGATEDLTFEVVEDRAVGNGQDDDLGDGFKLMTQSNELFRESLMSSDHASSGESGDDSSISKDYESDGSSSKEEVRDSTPLQDRRKRNLLRNNAYIESIKLGFNAMMNDNQSGATVEIHSFGQQKEAISETSDSVTAENLATVREEIPRKNRRGMIFSKGIPNERLMPPRNTLSSRQEDCHYTARFMTELKLKYPHRSRQIHILCSQLVSIVQKSKFAWQMAENTGSSSNMQCSEASYQGEVKLAASAPIMITGAGGNGKTSVVKDALDILQRGACHGATPSRVAVAYVDCASSDSGSVAAVMHNAYRQLFECIHPSCGFGKNRLRGNEKTGEMIKEVSGKVDSTLEGDDFAAEDEIDIPDEDSIAEDLLEQQRNRKRDRSRPGKKSKNEEKTSKSTAYINNRRNAHQTRLKTRLATEEAHKAVGSSPSLKGSIQNATNRISQSSSAVALFGRATSALIQGNPSKKKTPESWRCTFLVLDNADRILSWKKNGSVSPLTALFLLPSVFGINLTMIFISRSTIIQYSRELVFSDVFSHDRLLNPLA